MPQPRRQPPSPPRPPERPGPGTRPPEAPPRDRRRARSFSHLQARHAPRRGRS